MNYNINPDVANKIAKCDELLNIANDLTDREFNLLYGVAIGIDASREISQRCQPKESA